MKDKRINKIKQHIDVFINGHKFRVISCKIDDEKGILSIKTKIFGQVFPYNGRFIIIIPSENLTRDLYVSFRTMSSNTAIEHWEYSIIKYE